jgi:hypothetical protein
MRKVGRSVRVGRMFFRMVGLLPLLFVSALAGAATEVTFSLPEDASRQFMQAALWREFREFGTDYHCDVIVVRPALGEAPLQHPENRIECRFKESEVANGIARIRFGETLIEATGKPERRFFIARGEIAESTFLALTEFFHRRGNETSTGLLDRETTCNSAGECTQTYTLVTRSYSTITSEKIYQMQCIRTSGLKKFVDAPKIDRSSLTNPTAYNDELIYLQDDADERVTRKSFCQFFPFQPVEKPVEDPTRKPAPKEVSFDPQELREISYYWPGSNTTSSIMGKYSVNAFQRERLLKPFLSRTLSQDAYRMATDLQLHNKLPDERNISAFRLAIATLRPLYRIFKKHHEMVSVLIFEMTLIPDPDRWFLLAALASIEWKVLPPAEFARHLPKHWQELGELVISRREGNTIYVNQAFLDTDHFSLREQEGFDSWMLWETIKLWLLDDTKTDMRDLAARFSRSLSAGNFNEFRVKSANGRAGLAYIDVIAQVTGEVRATSQWPWTPENAYFQSEQDDTKPLQLPIDVRFQAPSRIEEIGGKGIVETTSLQYEHATPGSLDHPNRVMPFEVKLFCAGLENRYPAKARIITRRGQLLLQGTKSEWRGIRDLEPLTVEIPSASRCEESLEFGLRKAFQEIGNSGF